MDLSGYAFTPAYALEIGFNATEISIITIAFMIPHTIAAIVNGKYIVPMLGKRKKLKLAFCSVTFFTYTNNRLIEEECYHCERQ